MAANDPSVCSACRDGIRRELVWGTDDTYVHHYGDAPGTVVPCAYSDLPAGARPLGSQEGERTTGASKPSIGTAKPTDLASSSAGSTSTAAKLCDCGATCRIDGGPSPCEAATIGGGATKSAADKWNERTMKNAIIIVAIVAALVVSGSAAAAPKGWGVAACPKNSMIRIPCRMIAERNYGQALIYARYLNAHGWTARVVQLKD